MLQSARRSWSTIRPGFTGSEQRRLSPIATSLDRSRAAIRRTCAGRRMETGGIRRSRPSSLGYLTQLPFDKLKIDRIFIDGIAESERARKLLQGIIALGRGLNMTIVAEGAEKPGELEILRRFNCDIVQGYVLHVRRQPWRLSPLHAISTPQEQPPPPSRNPVLAKMPDCTRRWPEPVVRNAPAIAAGDCRAAWPGAPRAPAFWTGRPNDGRTARGRSPRTPLR
jgi:EAL domain